MVIGLSNKENDVLTNINCNIIINFEHILIPKIMRVAKDGSITDKPNFAARAKALQEQYGNYEVLDLIDLESLEKLEQTYLTTTLSYMDCTTPPTEQPLKELIELANNDYRAAPSSYQYYETVLSSQLDEAANPQAALKLIAKTQELTCKSIASFANYIFLYGIKEVGRLGLLMNQKLAAPLKPTMVNELITWKDKLSLVEHDLCSQALIGDIKLMFDSIAKDNQDISTDNHLALFISPKNHELLAPSVPELTKLFPNLHIIPANELAKSRQEQLALVVLQNSKGEPCFISDKPSFTINPFEFTKEPDDIPKHMWEITGIAPFLRILNPSFIARMNGIQ